MSLLPFLFVTLGGAAAAWFVRGRARVSAVTGVVILLGAIVTAMAIQPGQTLVMGGSGLVTTDYQRLFLVLASVMAGLLALVAAIAGGRRDLAPVSAAVLGTAGLALALPDPATAVVAATIGGAAGALLAVVPVGARVGATVGMRVLRAAAIAGTMGIAACAWIGRDLSELAAQPVVFGLAYLAMALAVALRFGAIPFHTWTARLAETVAETSLPLVMAIGPAAFAVVALAWADASIAPLLVDLDSARAVVIAIALASILLAPLAAWIQEDVEPVVGYAIVGDAGVVLLAMAALDPAAWEPGRIWILALIATRSAFAAWAGALRFDQRTGRIEDLRGWAFRSPLLGISLAVVALASIGLPGLAVFDARSSLISLALDGPLATIAFLGALLPVAYYVRLLVLGVERADASGEAPSRRPVLRPFDRDDPIGWARATWDLNRRSTGAVTALVAAVLALAVSAGALGGTTAAAGSPPTLQTPVESFVPEGPSEPDAVPDGSPTGEPDTGGSSGEPGD